MKNHYDRTRKCGVTSTLATYPNYTKMVSHNYQQKMNAVSYKICTRMFESYSKKQVHIHYMSNQCTKVQFST